MLEALPAHERSHRFIELWTCKEAWLKAAGLGISAGLASLEIELGTDRPRVVRLPGEAGEVDHWSLALLEPRAGLVAAVVLHDPVFALGAIGDRKTVTAAPGLVGERMAIDLQPRQPAIPPPL
jgi:4'-phosphopantetheinyl transferase